VQLDILAQGLGQQVEVLGLGGEAKRVRLGHADTLRPVPSDHTLAKISNSLGATGLRWAGKLNVPLYRLSGGRIGGKVGRAPVLLLTTTGRKSRQQRTAPVVYLADGANVVVINTNAGNAKVPAWSLNLKAKPEGEVELGRKRYPVRARVAEGEERAELWRKHNEQYAGFDDYQRKLDREASVIVLEPR
jgi:deazaflavin-dependent oxidoreductase (nitroreductase family)